MFQITCSILLIFGLIAGTLLDSVPVTAPAERGDYKVIQADFHVHIFFGGGVVSPFNIAGQAQRQGLHALAVTNHNEVFPGVGLSVLGGHKHCLQDRKRPYVRFAKR